MPTRTHKRTPVPEEFRSGHATQTQRDPLTDPVPQTQGEPFTDTKLISERQWNYICALLDKKDLLKSSSFFDAVNAMDQQELAAYIANLKAKLKHVPKKHASEVIEALLALPNKATTPEQRSQAQAPTVAPGRYALAEPSDELNPIRFYTVQEGRDNTARGGKDWSGYTFVNRHVSDERYPVKGKERYRVLALIAADPRAAAQLYASETNHCSRCGRELTRRISREMGMGEVCAGKSAFMGANYIEATRQQLYDAGLDPEEVMT